VEGDNGDPDSMADAHAESALGEDILADA
jgi:hypothetical protein